MGYESYRRLPILKNYGAASLRLEATKPLRKTSKGEDFTRYPLSSSRKDTQFLIRKVGDEGSKPDNKWRYKPAPDVETGDVELMLYQSPIITFHSGAAEFTIASGYYSWCSAYCAFIEATLRHYFRQAVTNRGRLVLSDFHNNKYVIPKGGHLRFKYVVDTREVTPVGEVGQNKTLRLNRRATNIVRARYGSFYRYMKGMIGVRRESKFNKWHDWTSGEDVVTEEKVVSVSVEELREFVPFERITTNTNTYDFVAEPFRRPPTSKPPVLISQIRHTDSGDIEQISDPKPYINWRDNTEDFLALVSATEDDPDQHEKFRKAFIQLAWFTQGTHMLAGDLSVSVDAFGKTMDEIIFKYHSEEVFERVPAKQGQVPNIKYESWVTRDRE